MSEGPLISCYFMMHFNHQVKQRVGKSQVEVCERRGKSFIKYFKGPFIKMLRRDPPYGNTIFM